MTERIEIEDGEECMGAHLFIEADQAH